MKSINLQKWTFHYDPNSIAAIASDEKIVFLTKEYDELHLVIEIEAGLLVFQPRWNSKTTKLDAHTFLIERSYA